MKADDARRVLIETIGNVAPDADPASVADNDDLRDALDLDSMDFLNIVIALHERLKIAIPESDYGRLRTMGSAVEYLARTAP
jgi:acyl carrier protein